MIITQLYNDAIELLKQLITTPSFSKEEDKTASIISDHLSKKNIENKRHLNNIWSVNKYFDPKKKTLLLNSHHDTVKPNSAYTRDPFAATEEDGKLFGLGSNDAGGCVVSLIETYSYFYANPDLNLNLVLAITAEEEISGINGIESLMPLLPKIDMAIVGEPTQTNVAVAEKGLMVLDCKAIGVAGHAAREEGENAIYKALKDIEWFRTFSFENISETLGAVKMSVTVLNTPNTAHNIVPAECNFVVDVRVTDAYTLDEVLEIIKSNVSCSVQPRSMRIRPSFINEDHPLRIAATLVGKELFGSPTTSDQALINRPSIKCGPGHSGRSHSADEFIYLNEIRDGITTYISLIENV